MVGTAIADFDPLTNLTSLKRLRASYVRVRDISALRGKTQLQRLELGGAPITDFSPLSTLNALQMLVLHFTDFADIDLLDGLHTMRNINLARTEITRIEPLSKMPELWSVDLKGTAVTDFSPLVGLPNLRQLYVGEPLSKEQYGATDSIPIIELGLNWREFEGVADVQAFVSRSG